LFFLVVFCLVLSCLVLGHLKVDQNSLKGGFERVNAFEVREQELIVFWSFGLVVLACLVLSSLSCDYNCVAVIVSCLFFSDLVLCLALWLFCDCLVLLLSSLVLRLSCGGCLVLRLSCDCFVVFLCFSYLVMSSPVLFCLLYPCLVFSCLLLSSCLVSCILVFSSLVFSCLVLLYCYILSCLDLWLS
jgi:hypothetical protein